MGIAGSVRKKGIVIPAKTGVVAVVAFQCWDTGHGMFDHPAVLVGTIKLAIAVSAAPMPRRSAAADGDLYTPPPTETNSPLSGRRALAGRNRVGVEQG